jgi:hypothetical protein
VTLVHTVKEVLEGLDILEDNLIGISCTEDSRNFIEGIEEEEPSTLAQSFIKLLFKELFHIAIVRAIEIGKDEIAHRLCINLSGVRIEFLKVDIDRDQAIKVTASFGTIGKGLG